MACLPTLKAFYVFLADGAGGYSGGGEAADFFVTELLQVAETSSSVEQVIRAFWALDERIAVRQECGETTGVMVAVTEDEVVTASVGDSEAWLATANGVQDLTQGQQRKPLLGSGDATPKLRRAPFTTGTLLIGSDGLFKYTTEENILELLQSGFDDATPPRLVDLVRLRSGGLQDDVSLALVSLEIESRSRER